MYMKNHYMSIRTKFYFLVGTILLVAILINILSIYFYSMTIKKYQYSAMSQIELNKFYQSNDSIKILFKDYILEPTNTNLLSYEGELGYAKEILTQVVDRTPGEEYTVKFKSLKNMLLSFEEQAQKAIHLIGFSDTNQLLAETEEAIHISDLIGSTYEKYSDILVQSQISQTDAMLASIQTNNMVVIATITIGLFIISASFYVFAHRITEPIILLSKNANEMVKRRFDIPKINTKSNDEIRELADAFDCMKNSIVDYIKMTSEQADLAQKLILEENKNLKSINLLKEANIRALQMQINSHFLFNTLNLISRTAFFEGAPKTIQLIDATTDFLKFSLYKAKSFVSIFDEIAFAESYIFIQRMRFGDRITFDLIIDDALVDMQVPALILQPLIENAIIHGTFDKIEPSKITVKVLNSDNSIILSVEDDGKGMDQKAIDKLFNEQYKIDQITGGIGLRNVRERLELFLNRTDSMRISSEKDKYFRVEIVLTLQEVQHENTDCGR